MALSQPLHFMDDILELTFFHPLCFVSQILIIVPYSTKRRFLLIRIMVNGLSVTDEDVKKTILEMT